MAPETIAEFQDIAEIAEFQDIAEIAEFQDIAEINNIDSKSRTRIAF